MIRIVLALISASLLLSLTANAQLADFRITKAKVILSKKREDADKIVLKAEAGVANIPPSLETEVVRITFGPFTDTIPAGGLERKDSGSKTTWKYKGDKGRLTSLKIQRKDFQYKFKATAKKLDLPTLGPSIPVTLEVGSDVNLWQGFFEVKDSNSKTLMKYPGGRGGDADGDGVSGADGDCDDQDASTAPGFPEICDLADNDCDGAIDEGLSTVVSGIDIGLCRIEIEGCLGGSVTTIQTGVGPQPEICDDGLDQDCDGSDCSWLQIEIEDPLPGAVTGVAAIDVSGKVSPAATSVTVNGVAATLASGGFAAVGVPLRDGGNLLTATAVDAAGRVATGSVSVVLDRDPPWLVITNPPDGAVLNATSIVVVGTVNDIVVGTVNAAQVQVTCNGIAAEVANRTFAVVLPLLQGSNSIACDAVDQAGNSSSSTIQVTVDPNLLERVVIVSGEYQAGTIGTQLPEPLVVRVDDENGQPIANQTVIFRVIQNDGLVSSVGETARSVAVSTDAAGEASVSWTLGSRAGAGLNRVRVIAPGIAGAAVFCASADTGPPGLIVVDGGNRQRGVVGERLPEPLVAVVVDDGSNRLESVPVTFRIVEGGGSFDGLTSTTVMTDSDGRARVSFRLGPQAGIENHLIEADYPGNQGYSASFHASAFVPGKAVDTRVSGIVLDNSDRPVPGVTVTLEDRFLVATTDGAGKFSFTGVLPGRAVMIVDGTTTIRPGVWPDLRFELEVVPGQDNSVQRGPIYLLPIDVDRGVAVDASTGGTLTIEQVPGFALEIAPGSVTFPDGSDSGVVSATLVHSDKVPMTPAFGQQPRFIITIQPAGARFDPPAKLTLPNTDGLAPGRITEMYSFDHDLNQFVAIGTGSVSADGSVIMSDPGIGVIKAGWHCGGNPNRTGSAANCPECTRCIVNLCLPVSGVECDDGDACTAGDTCSLGSCTPGTQIDCDDGNVCTNNDCLGGLCLNLNSRAGQPDQCAGCAGGTTCDDGDPCTANDTCDGGTCTGEAKDCDDNDACTADSCEPGVGCKHEPDALDCDDGNDCTTDVCLAGEGCVHDNSRSGAPDQCQGCSDDTPCNDVNECTEGDKCIGDACVPGPPADCDDENDCTNDSCDTVIGCQNENTRAGQENQCEGCGDDTPCEDNNLCTDEDKCSSAACAPGQARQCDDQEDCTEDQCDPETGCINEAREGSCDDGNECTPFGTCEDGTCTGEGNFCGNGVFESECSEECDGDSSPDCPGQCSADCRCCNVRMVITSPADFSYTCVGETIEVRGTVSEPVGVIVNGLAATVTGQEWAVQIPVPHEPGTFDIDAIVVDPSCQTTDFVTVTAVAVAKLEVPGGELIDDGDGDPDTSTYLVESELGSNPTGSATFFATVEATAEPPTPESDLPICWSLVGGTLVDRLQTDLDHLGPREAVVVASAGTSGKSLTLAFVTADVTEAPDQSFGYSPPTQLTQFLSSNPITAKSIKTGATDVMNIEVKPIGSAARVHVRSLDAQIAAVPTPVVENGPPQPLPIQGISEGVAFMQVNLGNESGPVINDGLRELRVYDERPLTVAVRMIVEDNDDTQETPVGQVPAGAGACVGPGLNLQLDTEPAGDDVVAVNIAITPGPNGRCDSVANNTDLRPAEILPSTPSLVSFLNTTVYNQAVVRWDVTRLTDVEVNYDLDRDGKFLSGCSKADSEELQAVVDAANPVGFDKVVFVLNVETDSSTCGCCDFPGRFCQVFAQCITSSNCSAHHVTAHELGHSVGFDHTPSDAANLMFPSCGTTTRSALRGLQWDIAHQ